MQTRVSSWLLVYIQHRAPGQAANVELGPKRIKM